MGKGHVATLRLGARSVALTRDLSCSALHCAVLSTVAVGWFLTIAHGDVENFYHLVSSAKTAVYTFLYIALFIGASNLQLIGYALIDGNSGPYNAICSCYPLVNLIVAWVFFGQKNLNLAYVVPAMIMIMGGVVLLAVAPPPATVAPVPMPTPTPTNTSDIPLSTP